MTDRSETTEAADMTPGAVWLAKRPGSRSANRIVQKVGRGTGYMGGRPGIWYRSGARLAWCSHGAWKRWVKLQSGEFSHVSPEHVK